MPRTTDERVTLALAAAAVCPELGGVLLPDLSPELLPPLAGWQARVWAPGQDLVTVVAGAATDADLWSRPRLSIAEGGPGVRMVPGPLTGPGPVAIVVPDLAVMSSAARIAALTTVGAPIAHLERHGLSQRFHPAARWLAACASGDLAGVSAHLLDRFPLRVEAAGLEPLGPDRAVLPPPPDHWVARNPDRPAITEAALRRATVLGAGQPMPLTLTLGRLAVALAWLSGSAQAHEAHVDVGGWLLGLVTEPVSWPNADPWSPPGRRPAASRPTLPAPPPVQGEPGVLPASEADLRWEPPAPTPEPAPPATAPASVTPTAPQRIAWGPPPGRRRSGPPVGTVRADGLTDIAVFASIREAAKFQTLRCTRLGHPRCHRLHLNAHDLRRHRRRPRANPLMILLLDHTSHVDERWFAALGPLLRLAYRTRARVALVEVGAADAESPWRAAAFVARGVLDPRVERALGRTTGSATPLAHGLHLVDQVLRRLDATDPRRRDEVLLAVLSDGRGNVPLTASLADHRPGPTAGEGITDAWTVARRVRDRRGLRSIVLDPGVEARDDLRHGLARVLGARTQNQ